MTTATTTPSWQGEVQIRQHFVPTGQFTRDGKPKLRPVRLIKIVLTRGYDAIEFNVTHRNGCTSVTDHREEATGFHGTQGYFGTREAAKAGKAKSYTPRGWADEVERYVGWNEAIALLMEAGCEF